MFDFDDILFTILAPLMGYNLDVPYKYLSPPQLRITDLNQEFSNILMILVITWKHVCFVKEKI